MSKSILRFSVFLLIGMGLLALTDRLMIYGLHQVEHDDLGVWNQLISGEINTDILCTGSSRTLVHIDPEIIGPGMGMSCFNLGLDGSPLNFQLPLLKTYYKYNSPPKFLVQGLDALSVQSRKNIYKAYQYIPYLDEDPVYENLIKYDSKFWRYRYLPVFGLATYGMELRADALAGLFGIKQPSKRHLGFTAVDKDWTGEFEEFKKANPNGLEFPIETEALDNLRAIIALAQEHGTEVVLVFPPEYYESQQLTLNHEEILDSFRTIANEHGLTFLDYSSDSLSYQRKMFYNSQHLKAKGARLFSEKLALDLERIQAGN